MNGSYNELDGSLGSEKALNIGFILGLITWIIFIPITSFGFVFEIISSQGRSFFLLIPIPILLISYIFGRLSYKIMKEDEYDFENEFKRLTVCPKCHNVIKKYGKFCEKCGYSIK